VSSLLSVENDIGVMAIEEPILRKSDFLRAFTGASYSDEIGNTIREASEHDVINAVFRSVYSPRGTVAGTSELAAAVAALNELKPIYACSSDLMASAAYWIASLAHAIHVAPFANSSLSYYFPDKLIGDVRN
jgi:ClpP class serine protease